MGRRRFRRARHRRTLAIVFAVFFFFLICLGVFVAAVAVNALSFERPDSAVPVLLPDSQETPGSSSP